MEVALKWPPETLAQQLKIMGTDAPVDAAPLQDLQPVLVIEPLQPR